MTELVESKARIAELERDATTAAENLSKASSAAHDEVFDLEGKVTNLTRQVDYVVDNAVATSRLCVHIIQTPTGENILTPVVPPTLGPENRR